MPGLTISQLILDIRRACGKTSNELDDAAILRYINRSWWQIQEQIKLPQNTVVANVNTVASTNIISVVYPVDGILSITRHDPITGELHPLSLISEEVYLTMHNTDIEGTPTHWFTRGTSIVLTPTPDAIYPLHITRRELLTDLVTGGGGVINIDNSLHEILQLGAVWRVFFDDRDYNSAKRSREMQAELFSTYVPRIVKEQDNWKFAQVRLISNTYSPN